MSKLQPAACFGSTVLIWLPGFFFEGGMKNKREKLTFGKTGKEKSERSEISGKVEGSFIPLPTIPRANLSLLTFSF